MPLKTQTNKINNKFQWIVLMFIPIFISQNGIFVGVISETGLHLGETGLVLPLIFFMGLYTLTFIIINIIAGGNININYQILILITLIIMYSLAISLIGFFFNNNYIILLRCFQFLTFVLGISLFYYLKIRNIDLVSFLKSLFYFLLIFMIIHFISSFIEIGSLTTIEGISPNVLFFGVYQSRVYYPYLIISLLFLSSIVIKNNKLKIFTFVLLGIYIFSLQVRGALISYLFYLIVYLILFFKRKIILSITLIIVFIYTLIKGIEIENLQLGRFGDFEKFYTLNGRIPLWIESFQVDNVQQLLFGNLFFDSNQISAHNQYIQFFENGGVILFILFLLIVVIFIKLIMVSILSKDRISIFICMVYIVPLTIDLNLNVPLNNVNSTIIYTFIWFVAAKLIMDRKDKKIEI